MMHPLPPVRCTWPLALTLLLLSLLAWPRASHAADNFESLRTAASASLASQPESAILALLDAGLAEHKTAQAITLTQQWLRDNVAQDPLLLYKAGRAAELSSDWRAASTLYQQFLARADLASTQADDAIVALYTLLINQLADPQNAYAYGRTGGHRLVASAAGRQFDQWFLNEAVGRKDLQAVSDRLAALIDAKVSNDLLIAHYHGYFDWLLDSITGWRLDEAAFSPELVASVRALAGRISFDPELSLLLDWRISAKAYNMSLLAGEQAQAPIAQAQALLAKYPQYALSVQIDWAGGHRGRHYRGDNRKYWPQQLDAKLAPVNAAVAKLPDLDQALFDQSYTWGYFDSGPIVLDAAQSRAWVLANPKRANSITAPPMSFEWNKLSIEQLQQLAPLLAANPSPEAAMIRVIAASGQQKDFDKALDQLLGAEAWRLTPNELDGRYADALWHWAGRPGGNEKRDQAVARSKKLLQSITATKPDAKAPLDKRLAAFKTLWQDYTSAAPKLPAVRWQLLQWLTVTPEALPQLLADPSSSARLLLFDAINSPMRGVDPAWSIYDAQASVPVDRFDPCIGRLRQQHRFPDFESFKSRMPEKCAPHPLAAAFDQALAAQIKRGSVEPWLVLAWLNTRFPFDNAPSIAMLGELLKSSSWISMPLSVRRGVATWFGDAALTPAQLAIRKAADPNLICADLLKLPQTADAATAAAALRHSIDGLERSPVRREIRGLERLAGLDAAVFADPAVFEQIMRILGSMRSFEVEPNFANRLFQHLSQQKRPDLLHTASAYLWRYVEVHHRPLPQLIALSQSLVETDPTSAYSLARAGLQTFSRYRAGHRYFNDDSDIPALKTVLGKSMLAMGLIDIPVPPTHPAYGIYRSQAQWITGNFESARELYLASADQLLLVHRRLSVAYLLWVLQVTIDQRDQAQQEALAKAMLAWMAQSTGAFTLEQRVALEIAYGDIAVQRGLLPEALKIFSRIADNKDYEPVYARHTATLRRALVQRISGDYDGALETLARLDALKIPDLTTEAHYARAEIFYAMQEYEDAAKEIDAVMDRDPLHADATILRGRVQLKLKKLIEATEVELGAVTDLPTLVPGELLKVTLNDPTLSVSGGATDIEVVVWASSGDREHVLLRQFGDEKTKYRGEVRTALGAPSNDDRTLQVIGDDEIFYAYSERFRQKMPNLGENRGGPITIASDAIMMASARRLLSENEQRVADLQTATLLLETKYRNEAQNIDPQRLAEIRSEAAEQHRKAMLQATVKPGNPIYVRVIDADRGRTADIDELAVSVNSSSGDEIGRITLKESTAYSGQFEGRIATAKAQAMAFASSTEPGRDANMTISPRTDYPAWRPTAGTETEHTLTVDLNDNAPIGSMQIIASEEQMGLKRFLVQSAMTHGDWTTLASYPAARMMVSAPWQPVVTVINEQGRNAHYGARSVYELSDLRRHMSTGWLEAPDMAISMNVAGPSAALPKSVLDEVKWLRSGRWPNPAVVYRFEAYFHEPAAVQRKFALDLGRFEIKAADKTQQQQPEFLIAVNGRVITTKGDKQLHGQIDLKPGVHRLEIWATGWVENIGFGRTVSLKANLGDDDQMVDCPDAFFDPATFPPGLLDHRNAAATITPGAEGKQFNVTFAPESRARLLRLVIVESQGPVPSINRITLSDPSGKPLLPVQFDYAELRKNDQLEIVTGDKITLRYVDDRFVTPSKARHERFLNVAYTDGSVEFADIEPRFDNRRQSMMPYHENLLRFALDKPLSIVVNDADMDVSDEPDSVKLTIRNTSGLQRELIAQETGPSTGVFRAWITPVAQATDSAQQIQVDPGGTLAAIYLDEQNLRPGVPYERSARISHGAFAAPTLLVAHASIAPFVPTTPEGRPAPYSWESLNERFELLNIEQRLAQADRYSDRIAARYLIRHEFVTPQQAPAEGIAVVHGRHMIVEVIAPHLALSESAVLDILVQTDEGRAATPPSDAPFNANAPGTLRITGNLGIKSEWRAAQRGGYASEFIQKRGNDYERIAESLATGRFRFVVPLISGPLPELSFAEVQTDGDVVIPPPAGLAVRVGQRVHIGVPYTDEAGNPQWVTASATVRTQPMLDVMEQGYRQPLTEAHVGEKLYLRVVDPAADRSADRDALRVFVATKSGRKHYMMLTETEPFSGIFKGICTLTYDTPDVAREDEQYDVAANGMPVQYGDAVAVRYTDSSGVQTPIEYVQIAKGSDGSISPFSKKYSDSQMAMRTQFAMAEGFLELARRHRKLGEHASAEREFTQAKQLLASVVAQFDDPETRAHAEYLLGNLTMEDAQVTDEAQLREDRYHASLARFMKVTSTYPDTDWASKAQFRIATVYEQLGESDIAAQEYVKLAYKYPDSEHLATAMARLGTHFQRKAVEMEEQAKPLLAQADNKNAQHEGQALTKLAQQEYIKAASIFERLQSRFPDDELAGPSGLRAGQIYMRVKQYSKAIAALESIIKDESYDGATLRSEAMYWAGRCYESLRQPLPAYSMYKRISYDFPESKWAAYARAQLSSEQMIQLDYKLETQRLEAGE